jgi:hypothetical protein
VMYWRSLSFRDSCSIILYASRQKPEAYEIGPGSFLRPFFGSSGYNRTFLIGICC